MADGFKENHQRLYQDGTESGSTALLAEDDTAETFVLSNLNVIYHYRSQVIYTGTTLGATSNLDGQLQYRRNGGTWTNVTGSSTYVISAATTNIADGANTTARLTSPGAEYTFSGTAQFDEVNGAVAAISLKILSPEVENGIYTECLFSIKFTNDIQNGDTIELRNTDAGTAFVNGYAATPTYTFAIGSGSFFYAFH